MLIRNKIQYTKNNQLNKLLKKYNTTPCKNNDAPILFGQKAISPGFSAEGYFSASKIEDVAKDIKKNKIDASKININYIWVNGKKVSVNNRSLAVLTLAGKKPVKTTDLTGKIPLQEGHDSLLSILNRLDEHNGKPSPTILLRSKDKRNSHISMIIMQPLNSSKKHFNLINIFNKLKSKLKKFK